VTSLDSFKSRKTQKVGSKSYQYFSLKAAEEQGLKGASRLPISLKVLLENLIRHEDGRSVSKADLKAAVDWLQKRRSDREIAFRPARVLMQDFTGVPAVVDLAAMRDAMKMLGGNPNKINPLVPVDLVIDHSVIVDFFGASSSLKRNVDMEYKRNGERYRFLNGARPHSIISASSRPAPASVIRSISNIFRRPSGAAPKRPRPARSRWFTRTRWSAPTATPPW
jgi:aconitate hydratase